MTTARYNPFARLWSITKDVRNSITRTQNVNPSDVNPSSNVSPSNLSPSGSQNISQEDLERAKLFATFDRTKEHCSWTRKPLTASGRCVSATMKAAQHVQKKLGVKPMGNVISSVVDESATAQVKGSSIKDMQKLFDEGKLKVGDTVSFTKKGNLNMGHKALSDGGQGTSNHAATITILMDDNGNPIMKDGKYQIGLIDNAHGTNKDGENLAEKKIISLEEFEGFVGTYSPYIYSVGRPDYGNSTVAVA
ncbi:MAG: hypothetical protein HRT47_07775 [Candidatus Caenarcaniphilales bacterium]|nr:hypothetical protein [Candidatus Caenarcaniphilales bacterium]